MTRTNEGTAGAVVPEERSWLAKSMMLVFSKPFIASSSRSTWSAITSSCLKKDACFLLARISALSSASSASVSVVDDSSLGLADRSSIGPGDLLSEKLSCVVCVPSREGGGLWKPEKPKLGVTVDRDAGVWCCPWSLDRGDEAYESSGSECIPGSEMSCRPGDACVTGWLGSRVTVVDIRPESGRGEATANGASGLEEAQEGGVPLNSNGILEMRAVWRSCWCSKEEWSRYQLEVEQEPGGSGS